MMQDRSSQRQLWDTTKMMKRKNVWLMIAVCWLVMIMWLTTDTTEVMNERGLGCGGGGGICRRCC